MNTINKFKKIEKKHCIIKNFKFKLYKFKRNKF